MEERDSIEYSWRRITADEQLSTGSCELCYVCVEPSADASSVAIYDGENTNGDEIITLVISTTSKVDFRPMKPVYCRRGLYVDLGDGVTAVFIQWREIGR